MFTGRTLAIVRISNDDPLNPTVTIILRDSRDRAPLAGFLVQDLVRLSVHLVNRADEAVLGDVLQVPTVLQPWSASRNVIGGALALDLDQNGHVLRILLVPWLEGLQELQTIALRIDGNVDGHTIFWRGLEGVLAWVVTGRGELESRGLGELERLSVRTDQLVLGGVKSEITRKGHSGDQVWGSDECVRGRVGVVATSEVAVVRSDDRVLLAFLDIATIPLTDAGAASVGQDDTAGILKDANLAITFDGGTDLFGARGDGELGLDLQTRQYDSLCSRHGPLTLRPWSEASLAIEAARDMSS